MRFERLSLDQGLSQSLVLCIAQDDQGFLWFGTEDGLNRYDGYDFRVYRHSDADSSSIASSYVYSLHRDSEGNLWVGTWGGGLDRYDPEYDRFLHYRAIGAETVPGLNRVSGILEDSRKILWTTTWGGGLCRVDRVRKVVERFPLQRHLRGSLQSDTLHGLAEDVDGKIWTGGFRTGVVVYDPVRDSCAVYRHNPSDLFTVSYDNTYGIYRDKSGRMWVGTWGGGLNRFDASRGRFIRYSFGGTGQSGSGRNVVFSVFEDSRNQLWVGTEDGLNILDASTGTFYRYSADLSRAHSLSSGRVQSLFEDAGGVFWVGTADGLGKMSRRLQFFQVLFPPNENAGQVDGTNVFGLCEDGSGNIWIGTYGAGLYCYARKSETLKRYRHNAADPWSLGNDNVLAVCTDAQGGVWVGTYGGGVERFVPEKDGFIHYRDDARDGTGLISDYVRCLLGDRRGRIWIGTAGRGLDCYDPKERRFVHYSQEGGSAGSLSDNEVECIFEDRSGTIWIGTASGGINRFSENEGRFARYVHDPANRASLSNNHVYAIHQDADGMMWVATAGGGLNQFDPTSGSFRCFTESDGLANNVVYGILEPVPGTLWLSTNNGLSTFTRASKVFKNFDVADGLLSQEFNYNSYCMLRTGDVLFGGIKGVTRFRPSDIKENTHIPPVVLTSFSVMGEPATMERALHFTNVIHLSYKENFFSFEFGALDYVAPSKNQYSYRLEGVDAEWSRPGYRRFANYTQVEPGEYVFRVKGANNDRVWNTQGTSVRIVITPPFWKTWWFKILGVVLVLALGVLAYQARVRRLLEVERMRLRIANDLHDDVGSNLSSIALVNEMLAKKLAPDDQIRKQLLEAGKSARQTVTALRDIVWLIHPEHDKTQDLILKLRDTAAVMLGGIEYTFECREDVLKKVHDIGFKRNLFLIFKEILNNVARHSSASRVDIQLREVRRTLEMSVADNGRGFDPAGRTNGNGLSSLRQRASQMKGVIDIQSRPGSGTTVTLQARIP